MALACFGLPHGLCKPGAGPAGGGQARALSYLGCLRPAPRSVPPRRHRRDPPPRRAQFHFHQTGGRVGAAGFLHAVVPRVRSGATSSARGRHDRDRSGVVLFFFYDKT